MLDAEETRLLAELTKRVQSSRAALSALTYPNQSVLYDGYRKLVETDAAARMERERARLALRAYRNARTGVSI